jgi:hypothetical protein
LFLKTIIVLSFVNNYFKSRKKNYNQNYEDIYLIFFFVLLFRKIYGPLTGKNTATKKSKTQKFGVTSPQSPLQIFFDNGKTKIVQILKMVVKIDFKISNKLGLGLMYVH